MKANKKLMFLVGSFSSIALAGVKLAMWSLQRQKERVVEVRHMQDAIQAMENEGGPCFA